MPLIYTNRCMRWGEKLHYHVLLDHKVPVRVYSVIVSTSSRANFSEAVQDFIEQCSTKQETSDCT